MWTIFFLRSRYFESPYKIITSKRYQVTFDCLQVCPPHQFQGWLPCGGDTKCIVATHLQVSQSNYRIIRHYSNLVGFYHPHVLHHFMASLINGPVPQAKTKP